MRLGVNVVRLTRNYTGVGRYIDCLLREWSRVKLPFEEVVLYTHSPLSDQRVSFPLDRFRVVVTGPRVPDPVWEWWALPGQARRCDVLFCPSYTLPLGYRGASAVAHFGPSSEPPGSLAWWRFRAYDLLYHYSVRRADQVFTAASWVKERLRTVYGVPSHKIDVIPLAASEEFVPATPERIREWRQRYGLGEQPYALFVGKLVGRHHILEMLEAFSQARARHGFVHRLVLVGPNPNRLDLSRHVRRLGIEAVVSHVPYMPAPDLPLAYSGAEVFIYPSAAAEGFGIPLLEAMACGTPAIGTRLGSVPEVVGDAAWLLDANSVEELAGGLARLLLDAPLRQQLRARGLDRARSFSWRRTAGETMAILERLARSSAASFVRSGR